MAGVRVQSGQEAASMRGLCPGSVSTQGPRAGTAWRQRAVGWGREMGLSGAKGASPGPRLSCCGARGFSKSSQKTHQTRTPHRSQPWLAAKCIYCHHYEGGRWERAEGLVMPAPAIQPICHVPQETAHLCVLAQPCPAPVTPGGEQQGGPGGSCYRARY